MRFTPQKTRGAPLAASSEATSGIIGRQRSCPPAESLEAGGRALLERKRDDRHTRTEDDWRAWLIRKPESLHASGSPTTSPNGTHEPSGARRHHKSADRDGTRVDHPPAGTSRIRWPRRKARIDDPPAELSLWPTEVRRAPERHGSNESHDIANPLAAMEDQGALIIRLSPTVRRDHRTERTALARPPTTNSRT